MKVFIVKHHEVVVKICRTRESAFKYIKSTVLDILEIEENDPDFVNFINRFEIYDQSGSWSIEEWEVAE